MTRVLHVSTRDFLTPDPFELQTSVSGQNGIEFHWESNGHGPRHVTRVLHVSTRDFLTPDHFDVHTSVRGQNGVEFHQESNGHGHTCPSCVLL